MSVSEPLVAVGTTRAPKLRAVERALVELRERFSSFLAPSFALAPHQVPSGAPSTPMTTAEMMRGAQNRAEAVWRLLHEEGSPPALAIGLEGGVVSEGGLYFLESWAYVTDGVHGHFGSSGCVMLPDGLARAVFDRGEDLGPAADRFFHKHNVRSHEGTFGVLTGDVVTREDAFVRSLLHALAPFYNADRYVSAASTGEGGES
jgi:non-canonical (house-cleaning) NTP pyrophosphatase